MALRVVTDSTADIPDRIARQLGIVVIPLNVHFGEESLKDGEDIWAEEFFHRIVYASVVPHTSQPTPEEFVDIYHWTSQPGDTILSIHVANQLSDTFRIAQQGAKIVQPERQVIPIDSGLVSMGLGWLVIEAARSVNRGDSLETVLARVEKLRQRIRLYFTVETMEYLYQTGRYVLNERPQFNQRLILGIQEGKMINLDYIRGSYGKIGQHMLDLIRRDMAGQPFRIALVHANLAEEVERIKELLMKPENEIREMIVTSVGPVVGAYTGSGMLGLIAVPILP
jgi:DegV family protein with EDD domain